MAIKIKFDTQHNIEQPTTVLASRNGSLLGALPSHNVQFEDTMTSSEVRFDLYKPECTRVVDGAPNTDFWKQIKDFKLIWVREWNAFFEAHIEINESDESVKNVSCVSLGEAELSQINLYGVEINTEDDIAREDYKPTVLYSEDKGCSLIDRLLEKAPHYAVKHVDTSIANIQRTFSFDGTSIYDALNEISEEINCLVEIECYLDANMELVREISIHDMESLCGDCNYRGEFIDVCPKCGSTNVYNGYGEDTTIFVSVDNLADNITYSTDVGAVKNCFKLEAGDDLMTATLANCNPNGSGYIWYVSDESKEDMSDELVTALEDYDDKYNEYYNNYSIALLNADDSDYTTVIDSAIVDGYNELVNIYDEHHETFSEIVLPITGFPALMKAYYDTIDFYLYLNNGLMPSMDIPDTTAAAEGNKLNHNSLSPVAVQNISICSASTASSAALAMAKVIVDSRYQVKVSTGAISDYTEGDTSRTWSGTFTITNYSNEEDTYTTGTVNVTINDDYENYVRQKIDKALNKSATDTADIVSLFALEEEDFRSELTRYCLVSLKGFHGCCQACLDILIEQGVADKDNYLYESIYLSYYNKLKWIEYEIVVRENEIAKIIGRRDIDGDLVEVGIQNFIEDERNRIQRELDFQQSLGSELWAELASFRREDTFSNTNYISDGLNNSELIRNALEFIEAAKKEIIKSATLQHTISATLKNLLVMKEFASITDHFKIGNWLRARVDDEIYKQRLIEYKIDFNDVDNLSVTFSDVKNTSDGVSDVESVLSQASSMATSYSSVARQATNGNKGNTFLHNWVDKGIDLTTTKIVNSADNQNITMDSHGLLAREYLPVLDEYDERQLKLINKGLYLTDNNWETSRAGIGNFTFYNPETERFEESYGVIADTLVGNLILSEKVGVYNTNNSIVMGENGIVITTDNTEDNTNQMAFTIQKKSSDGSGGYELTPAMYIDSDGNVVLNGSIKVNSSKNESVRTIDDLSDMSGFSDQIMSQVHNELHSETGVYSTIDAKYEEAQSYADSILNGYKTEVGQYMQFDESGLVLGASTSAFRTTIDNNGMYFKEGDTIVSYVSNNQLNIPTAVINNNLIIGKYFASSREDGGFSISWQGD